MATFLVVVTYRYIKSLMLRLHGGVALHGSTSLPTVTTTS